jgi:hypothetical protein
VGGLPLWLTTDEFADCFDRGRTGRGRKALEHIDPHRKEEFSEDILREVIAVFRDLQVKIRNTMWRGKLPARRSIHFFSVLLSSQQNIPRQDLIAWPQKTNNNIPRQIPCSPGGATTRCFGNLERPKVKEIIASPRFMMAGREGRDAKA